MFKINKDKMVGFEIKTVHNLLKRDFESLPIHEKNKNITSMQKWIICYLNDNKDALIISQKGKETWLEAKKENTIEQFLY